MKKGIIIIIIVLSFALITQGQVRLNVGLGGTVSSTSAFLDASSYTTWNNSTDNGKGLVFPRVELVNFTAIKATVTGVPTSYPSRFDGMIVYNSATGTAGIGGTEVSPGLFIIIKILLQVRMEVPWVRLTDGNDSGGSSATLSGTEFPSSAVAGQVFYRTDLLDYYYYNSTEWVGVSNKWIPAHEYATGNFVEYGGNFYIANTDFTSDATDFATDADKWNYAGGKDAKYYMSEMKMDGQSLTKVAVATTTVPTDVADNTLVTVGYMNANGGVSTFDANRTITRTGLDGITGQNLNTSTVTDFLNKLFFPVLSPVITSFNYNSNTTSGQYSYQTADAETKVVTDTEGTVTIPYSTWSSLTDLVFNYSITQRDGSSSITNVELLKSGTSLGAVTDGALSGLFNLTASSYTNIDATQTIPLTLQVTDDASNVVDLVLNTVLTKANGATLSNARISTTSSGSAYTGDEGSGTSTVPYLIERTGSDIENYFVWSVTLNDDAYVTDIDFTGSPALSDLSGTVTDTYTSVVFPHNDATTTYRVGASAKGSVANDWSTIVYSSYYKLQDRLYCGFLASNDAPAQSAIESLQQNSLGTATYFSTDGVTLTNSTGSSGFFTWAVPTYVEGTGDPSSFSKTAHYYATGQWFENSNVTTHYVAVTKGSATTWYWVCIYNASTANGGSVQAKLSN